MDTGKYFIALVTRAKECNLTLHLKESYETPIDPDNLFSRIEAGDFCVEARGTSLAAARDNASIQMLEKLESLAPISNKNTVPVDTRPTDVERSSSVDRSPTELENGTVNPKPHDRPDFGLGKDPTMRLSELQMARKQPYATYRQFHGEIKGAELLFAIEATVDKVSAVGTGSTKKEAKRRASTALLQKMGYQVPETDLLDLTAPQTSSTLFQTVREEAVPVDRSLQKQDTVNQSQTTAPPTSKRNKTPVHIGPDFGLGKDPCSRLSELQMLRRERYAVYRTLEEKMVDKNKYMFTIEASLNQFTATGKGCTKKEAKKRASAALLLTMGFTVPEEELLIENVSQKHQVTSEPHSREEQCSEDKSPSQERAENLDCSEVNSQDHQALAEHSESQADEEQSPLHGSESQSEQQTPEEREICSSENRLDDITAPEKPTEVKTPEGPRDDVDESVTEEPHVDPLSTAAPDTPTDNSGTSGDSQTGILDQGPEETSPRVVQTLGDSLKDAEYPDQSPLLWSDSETSPTPEQLSSADFSCYKDSSSCTDYFWLDGISKLFQSPEGSQISEELEILISSEFRWLDGLSNIYQSPVEVPEGEIVAKIPETLGSSSDVHQSLSEAQSVGEQENLDEYTQTAKDDMIPEKTQLPENSTEQEGQEEVLTDELCKVTETTEAGEILPDHSVETDPDSSVDSETRLDIRSLEETSQEDLSCPTNTISDGHQILQEIFNLALSSPLWAETREDVNEDLATEQIDTEIPELSHKDDSVDKKFNINEDSLASPKEPSFPEDICSVDYQSPSETPRPEKQDIQDDKTNSKSPESLVETQNETRPKDTITDGHQILKEIFNLALNSPLWAETLEDVDENLTTEEPGEDSELKELSHIDDIFDIYEDSFKSPEEPSCPEDICSEGHQSLDESQDPAPGNPIEFKIPHDPTEDLCDEDSKLHAVPESTEAPETVSDCSLERFVIWVMVKKLLKNQPAHLRSYHDKLVDLLVKAALDHFKVPEGVHLKPKNVQKLGKAAARDLMHEYGGSLEVLLAAVGTKTVEFQEDAVKHLNIHLNAFQNRPKSGLKRFFSQWDKPYY